MRIKFKSPDPRVGLVAQMDSSRGQHLIDAGAAEQVSDNEEPVTTQPPQAGAPAPATAPAPVTQKPDDLLERDDAGKTPASENKMAHAPSNKKA